MSGKLMTWEAAVQQLKSQPEQQEIARQCYYDDPLQVAADRCHHSEEWLAVKLRFGWWGCIGASISYSPRSKKESGLL
jgi:hypothetical protein